MNCATVTAHFGEWVQGRLGPNGPVVLVTMVCPKLHVSAPGAVAAPFTADVLNRFAAQLGLGALPAGITRNFPLGIGAGASTAALVAMARAAGYDGPPEQLARACLCAEKASDPLMFPNPDRLLWASRQGRVVRAMAGPPRAAILGGLWGNPVQTDAEDEAFDDVSDLVEDWAQAAAHGDLARLGAVASESARRCSARRGPPDPMADLAQDLGALAVVRAHTGSARGLVFAPGAVPVRGADALREAGLTDVLTFETGGA
ncbi:hypothetical protein ACP2AV_03775 [Aliiroseovarius sp. PTFE2010]|uniref:hypothetical protein n=1 Tax=Aliiroseovarius sp. PTFE2010 TaxID=3417190 RepID=UPI003CEE01C1